MIKVRLGGYNTVRLDVDLAGDVKQDLVLTRAAGSDAGSGAKTQGGAPIETEIKD